LDNSRVSGWRIEDLDADDSSRDPRFDPLELGGLVLACVLGIALVAGFVGGPRTEPERRVGETTPQPVHTPDVVMNRPARAFVYVGVDDPQGTQRVFTMEGDRLRLGSSCVPARLGAPLPSPTLLVPQGQPGPDGIRWGNPPQWVLVSCYQAPSTGSP
jgi:hypothetical protein